MINTKQRTMLKSHAQKMQSSFQVGKNGVIPSLTEAIDSYLEVHEIVKLSVLDNCDLEPRDAAEQLAGRTRAQVVQVIGRKIILFREPRDRKSKLL